MFLTIRSLFDETFFHMTVGFLGMLLGAFVVIGVAGHSAQKHQAAQSRNASAGTSVR